MSHSTPNLPSRDFETTFKFYRALGFKETWRDKDWMILERDTVVLEFFVHSEVDPKTSWFSCCLRLDDLDGFYAVCVGANIIEATTGEPRLHKPKLEGSGLRIGALIDPDGTLLRLIQN